MNDIFSHPDIICSYSMRPENMSLTSGDIDSSLENRRVFLSRLGIEYSGIVCTKQVHGNSIRRVRDVDRGKGALDFDTAIADTDALITDRKVLPLAVFTADCLSVFLYDPVNASIGIVHAGWRSTLQKIAAKTIWAMKWEFKSKPEDMLVGFGPAIRSCCYEVGDEFRDFFPDDIVVHQRHLFLDLIAANKRQLLGEGLGESSIRDCGICTSCRNKEYFSYRKEGKPCGRIMSVIMLK